MEVIQDKIHHIPGRDSYWSRIYLKSANNKETLLFVCASHEYLGSYLKKTSLNESNLNVWINDVTRQWVSKGDSIFKKRLHLEVGALTEHGYKNGLEFLKREIVPNL
jgi:hypothetical protein